MTKHVQIETQWFAKVAKMDVCVGETNVELVIGLLDLGHVDVEGVTDADDVDQLLPLPRRWNSSCISSSTVNERGEAELCCLGSRACDSLVKSSKILSIICLLRPLLLPPAISVGK